MKLIPIFILIVLNSCSELSKQTAQPSFLFIDSLKVSKNINFGDNSYQLNGVYLNIESEDRGVWNIKSQIPILSFGQKKAIFYPFIKVNNQSINWGVYPLMSPIEKSINFISGNVDTLNEEFSYNSNVKVLLLENFDISTSFNNAKINTSIFKTGNGSLQIDASPLSADSNKISTSVVDLTFVPSNNIFLEFDYYMPTEGILSPRISVNTSSGEIKNYYSNNYIRKNDDWQHVYWLLSDIIGNNSLINGKITFELLTKNNKEATVYIDNLKVITD